MDFKTVAEELVRDYVTSHAASFDTLIDRVTEALEEAYNAGQKS